MLKAADNELLTRVENGAPMGEMLRNNYWFPATLSCLLERDGKPVRIRMLGEPFVAFRSTDGRVGLFDEHCPHRRASLALARNEDNALRCIYHGWKFGVDGTVVEVPTEPNNQTDFCKHVPLRHFPTREAAGIVWAWIGKGTPTRFPDFEFNTVPENQVFSIRQDVRCNWVQDLEAGMDSAHVGILHSHWVKSASIGETSVDTAPVFEFEPASSGYRYAAIRKMPDGKRYVRVSQFVMPWFSLICPEEIPEGDRLVIITTPTDDYNCVHWMIRYNRVRPLKPSWINPASDRGNFPPRPPAGPEANWGQDREAMARGHFSGFHHLNTEDFAAGESQGAIADRSREYLNAGDGAIVHLRKQLLETVRNYKAGKDMPLARHDDIPYPAIKADALMIPEGENWKSAVAARDNTDRERSKVPA